MLRDMVAIGPRNNVDNGAESEGVRVGERVSTCNIEDEGGNDDWVMVCLMAPAKGRG